MAATYDMLLQLVAFSCCLLHRDVNKHKSSEAQDAIRSRDSVRIKLASATSHMCLQTLSSKHLANSLWSEVTLCTRMAFRARSRLFLHKLIRRLPLALLYGIQVWIVRRKMRKK